MTLRYSDEELEETLKNPDISVQHQGNPLPALAAAVEKRKERNNEEDRLLGQIIELAKLTGWTCAHFRPALLKDGTYRTAVSGDGKGFPDLVLVREGRITNDLIFIECKSSIGKLSIEQTLWKTLLEKTLTEYYIWRPGDWGAIKKRLS